MKYRIFLLLLLFFLIKIHCPSTVSAQTVLFSDNFNDGDANGWIVIGNSGWNVLNNEYGIRLSPGKSNTVPSDSVWNSNWNNYIFEADIRGIEGTDKNLIFHFKDESNFYDLHAHEGIIDLAKYLGSPAGILIAGPKPLPLTNGATYHFKIEVNGDHIKIYEKETLLFDITDANPKIIGGKIGLRAGTGASTTTQVWYDNILVTEIPTLPNINVPLLKQTDPIWKDKQYDKAPTWTKLDSTIKTWGCALTSASMLLKFYGFSQAAPDFLNDWLNNQPDGYIRNGLVNWLAISRFTKNYSTNGQPILEYRRLRSDKQTLIDELTHLRPSVLEEPGHFVVAKSQLPSSFGINDPYYDRNTLDSYNNKFLSLGSYTPSLTDLSYLLLVIDENIGLQVLSSQGEEIIDKTFIQNPISPDPSSNTSMVPIKIFMLPKPFLSDYKIIITGDGEYLLESYLYDANGNVTTNSNVGFVQEGQPNSYIISVKNKQINKELTLASIMNDIDLAFEKGLLKNFGLYNAIKQLLSNALKLIQKS